MTSLRKSVLTGSAAIALIACAGLALAQSALHHMTVALPDGGTAQIAYSGDIPPQVTFEADPFRAEAAYVPDSFATFDRISAALDQEMNAAMNGAGFWAMPMPTPAQIQADLRNDPHGSFCMESMSVTRTSPDAAPKVVSHRYGNCAPMGQAAFGIAPEQRTQSAHTIEVQTPRAPKHVTGPSLIEAAYQPR